jgi:hypothetical protein
MLAFCLQLTIPRRWIGFSYALLPLVTGDVDTDTKVICEDYRSPFVLPHSLELD